MSPKALPFLVKYIDIEPKAWQTACDRYLEAKFPASRIATRVRSWIKPSLDYRDVRVLRKGDALIAFDILGPRAEAAVPLLARCLDRTHDATRALAFIGEKGFPPILAVLTNQQTFTAAKITWELQLVGTNAIPAIPILVQNLRSTNTLLSGYSSEVLDSIENSPHLSASDMIGLWGYRIGSNNIPARLIETLKSTNAHLAECSALMLGQLHPNPELSLPPLLDTLKNDSRIKVRIAAVKAVAGFGDRGLPALKEALTDPELSIRTEASNSVNTIKRTIDKPQ
jgi:hypothetical protein